MMWKGTFDCVSQSLLVTIARKEGKVERANKEEMEREEEDCPVNAQ